MQLQSPLSVYRGYRCAFNENSFLNLTFQKSKKLNGNSDSFILLRTKIHLFLNKVNINNITFKLINHCVKQANVYT